MHLWKLYTKLAFYGLYWKKKTFLAITHGEQESSIKIYFNTIHKFIKFEYKYISKSFINCLKNLNTKKKDSKSKTPLCLTRYFKSSIWSYLPVLLTLKMKIENEKTNKENGTNISTMSTTESSGSSLLKQRVTQIKPAASSQLTAGWVLCTVFVMATIACKYIRSSYKRD